MKTDSHDGQVKRGTVLNCFSPPVMLATFAIEMTLAAYVMWRYKLDPIGRLAVAMLFFLGLFQLSEYFVCGGAGMSAENWARIGYVAITTLPPLGLHMLHILAKRQERSLVWLGYGSAAAFTAFFLGYGDAFTGYQCTGNYVIFQLATHTGMLYGIYYYGWLLTTVGLGLRWARGMVSKAGKTVKGSKAAKAALEMKSRHQAIYGLVVGYLVFLVPTAVANSVRPETRAGIPSIMCGFAVLYAIILALYIMPRAGVRQPAGLAAGKPAKPAAKA